MSCDGIYKSHCIHGNPIYYSFCPACRAIKQQQETKRYNDYWERNIKIKFNEYFNDTFKMFDPSLTSEDKLKVRNNDKFYKLKTSNSEEDLKKEYYKLAKRYHPDKGGSTKLFQKLQQLYHLLKSKF